MKYNSMRFLTIIFLLVLHYSSAAQAPTIKWQKTLGGSDEDDGYSILATQDSGFIVVGETYSSDGDIHGYHSNGDGFIMKLNASGTIVWSKTLGGSAEDGLYHVTQTSDGNYIAAGTTSSSDGDIASSHGFYDYWVVKFTPTGTVLWNKTYGGAADDEANAIQQASDGGYIVVGYSSSSDGDLVGNKGYEDVWVLKLNDTGSIQWQKNYGGSKTDEGTFIRQTTDGGYIVCGTTYSSDSDITSNHGQSDVLLFKISNSGSLSWAKTFGGSNFESAYSLQQTFDKGFIISGSSSSFDGDVTSIYGNDDIWLVKTDSAGNLTWQSTHGGTSDDEGSYIYQTSDSGYVVTGTTTSNDYEVTGQHGSYDVWLLKTNSTGTLVWQKTLGGDSVDAGFSVCPTLDNGYAIFGLTNSDNGDVSGKHGGNDGIADAWLIKLSNTSAITEVNAAKPDIKAYPTITSSNVMVDLPTGFELANMYLVNALGQKTNLPYTAGLKRIISLSNLASGVYTLEIVNGNNHYSYNVVKK